MKEIKGDLIKELKEGRISALCHVCNDQGIMGSGIALQIKNEYPEAYAVYIRNGRELDFHSDDWLGGLSWASNDKNEEIVYNMVAQRGYGKNIRHLNYEALYDCLEEVRNDLIRRGKNILGIPKFMGSFRAGGDWRIVEKMIEVVFENSGIEVVIVEYDKGKV